MVVGFCALIAASLQNYIKTASSYGLLSQEELSRLSVVLVNLEDEESIRPAIGQVRTGRSAQVVCTTHRELHSALEGSCVV